VVRYALVDRPAPPSAPQINASLTKETQVAVSWDHTESAQLPGARVFGYVLEMMNTATTYGDYSVVFDGSRGFPDVKSFIVADSALILPGQAYLFRVKASFQNGFTDYSPISLKVFACSSPGLLLPPALIALSSTHITMQWDQPRFTGACTVKGFALYMNEGANGDVFTEIDQS
jgi:hypothetical protein